MVQPSAWISRREEAVTVLLTAVVVVLFTTLPYAYALLATPEGAVFSGLLANPIDGNSYLSKMMQGAQEGPVFRLVYTSEDHAGAFLSGMYLLLGMFAGAFGLSLPVVFHVSRILAGIFLLITAYFALGFFLRNKAQQGLAFLLFSVGSGFGWIGVVGGYLSPDLTMPELNAFYTILANPHFSLGLGLTLCAFVFAVLAFERGKVGLAVIAGMFSLLLGFVQPYMLVVVYSVILGWVGWNIFDSRTTPRNLTQYSGGKVSAFSLSPLEQTNRPASFVTGEKGLGHGVSRHLAMVLPVMFFSLPALVVTLPPLYFDPVFKQWTAQNITPSPAPWDYATGYGFLGIFAVVGLLVTIRGRESSLRDPRMRFVVSWLFVSIVLVYSPVSLQRRLIEGFQFPLVILAALGAHFLIGFVRSASRRRLLRFSAVMATLPTGLFLLVFLPLGGAHQPDLVYLPVSEVEAMQWLRQNSSPRDLVLASPLSGNIIPSWSGNRVYYGHPFETVRAEEKEVTLGRFFGGMSATERHSFIAENRIAYLYFGLRERSLSAFNPYEESYLKPIYSNKEVTIFKVLA